MPTDITGLLVRRIRQAVVDGTGESEEVDFDIPIGHAIRIYGIDSYLEIGSHDGATIEMESLVDLDGAALAANAVNTQALFEAREVLASAICLNGMKVDMVTDGASFISQQRMMWFPQDREILTARNPGVAWLSLGESGEGKITFYYTWVRISTSEFGQLIASRRA